MFLTVQGEFRGCGDVGEGGQEAPALDAGTGPASSGLHPRRCRDEASREGRATHQRAEGIDLVTVEHDAALVVAHHDLDKGAPEVAIAATAAAV